ncbi:Cis-2,3-dihydrobiphenyl-2,3-diol dehydrogenase [Corynebacterium ciconiae DSM 44920]|uniref:SDR family NAD(P)-dependent oxidoreductase n=1 Tax=Corynebacterium ciconiae TaxID=227319 RepID=UPI0004779AD3|nr:SDR family NAD(P)-dependent oxidoreductase [Corynebacterium ciconiae]WKD61579.1 Cis-2,3-dihydrobiphenyl-2,3-diol dehydrogenase [Corynebacterium ciconiae DSM 44920]
MTQQRFQGHTLFITGAGSGLGAALARRFHAEGANVSVVDVSLERAHAVTTELGTSRALACSADVRSPHELHAAVDETCRMFGGIDTVIPNAGIWDYNRSVTRLNGDELASVCDEVFGINVKGYLLTVEATWRELVKSEGSIIMTLSNASYYPAGGGPVYTAAKFADRGLMLQFAHELAPKVRVNGVAVGGMRTDLRGPAAAGLDSRSFKDTMDRRPEGGNPYIPLHDISTDPRSFTGPYVMLADPADGANMTGSVIQIDGGIAARGFHTAAGGDCL